MQNPLFSHGYSVSEYGATRPYAIDEAKKHSTTSHMSTSYTEAHISGYHTSGSVLWIIYSYRDIQIM